MTVGEFYPKLVARDPKGALKIVWSDDKECIYPLRELRFNCQCAVCKHEMTGDKLIKIEDISKDINITAADVVGNYALHFVFSDGHTTGIYSYDYLRKLGG